MKSKKIFLVLLLAFLLKKVKVGPCSSELEEILARRQHVR